MEGGGLRSSHDDGFGLLDLHAAVRLAETWFLGRTEAATSHNLAATSTAVAPGMALFGRGQPKPVEFAIPAAADLRVSRVQMLFDAALGTEFGHVVDLVSPDKTTCGGRRPARRHRAGDVRGCDDPARLDAA